MKRQILTIAFIMLAISTIIAQTSINPDTVCAGSTEEYKIESPNTSSTYTWGIYKGGGTIQTATNLPNIQIKWNNTAGTDSIWVFETNQSACKGDTAKLTVVRISAPTAQFQSETLCYGDKLNVIFNGKPPYTIEYTFNGNNKSINNINTNQYTLSEEAGEYKLTKVSSLQCVGTLVPDKTTSTISEQLKQLKIIRKP